MPRELPRGVAGIRTRLRFAGVGRVGWDGGSRNGITAKLELVAPAVRYEEPQEHTPDDPNHRGGSQQRQKFSHCEREASAEWSHRRTSRAREKELVFLRKETYWTRAWRRAS